MGGPGQEYRAAFWRKGLSELSLQPSLGNELAQDSNFSTSKIENVNSYLKVTRFGDYINKEI